MFINEVWMKSNREPLAWVAQGGERFVKVPHGSWNTMSLSGAD